MERKDDACSPSPLSEKGRTMTNKPIQLHCNKCRKLICISKHTNGYKCKSHAISELKEEWINIGKGILTGGLGLRIKDTVIKVKVQSKTIKEIIKCPYCKNILEKGRRIK